MVGGLKKKGPLRTPPDFCATGGPVANKTASNGPAVANASRRCLIAVYLPWFLRVRCVAKPAVEACSVAAVFAGLSGRIDFAESTAPAVGRAAGGPRER